MWTAVQGSTAMDEAGTQSAKLQSADSAAGSVDDQPALMVNAQQYVVLVQDVPDPSDLNP